MRIGIVGTGIAGLGAAWALNRKHEITVFEAASRAGGHSNTVDVRVDGGAIPVDTGFIVYNERTYPHLTQLFRHLRVKTRPSDMSFAFSRDGGLEYAGSLPGLFAQPAQLLRGRYRRMISDILRFRRTELGDIDDLAELSLDSYLRSNGFSDGFIDDYLLPMTAAIWSAPLTEIRQFPALAMLRFLSNHGLIRISDRPQWRTVVGGSRTYVESLIEPFADRIRYRTPVSRLHRMGGSVLVEAGGEIHEFDQVVLACHTDQALRILADGSTSRERTVLTGIPYQSNRAVLHHDERLMPRNRRVWSSWNYMSSPGGGEVASVTYWMNRLQGLPTETPVLVSLNPVAQPRPELTVAEFNYSHPQFVETATRAQRLLPEIQGEGGVWFAGAWAGYGFHEDGLQSGLNVAAALGAPVPWQDDVVPMSSSPPAPVAVR